MPARAVLWSLRVSWALFPFTVGSSVAGALHDRMPAVRATASVGLWTVWLVVLVATLVPHPVSLTALRVAAPAAATATLAAALGGHPSPLAAAAAGLALALAFAPETGASFVNGPAYPNERRLPLRVPGPLLLGPLELAWLLAVAPPVAGTLLVAAGRWVAGGVLLGLGVPLAVVLLRALHQLSRRWVVFVPAGFVLHDPLSLTDPVLVPRKAAETVRPAPADTTALDLTQRALGLALEVVLREPAQLMLVRPGRRSGVPTEASALLFTPTRPGAVLAEAEARRFPVSRSGD